MQIVLTPELEALVQQQLDTGHYDSAIDVITQAINLLQQQDNLSQEQLEALQHAAHKIDEAYRTTEPPVDGHIFANQLRQRISSRNT
jgi:antitoxin ParD1/3/4